MYIEIISLLKKCLKSHTFHIIVVLKTILGKVLKELKSEAS